MRHASTTSFLAILLLATTSRATEQVAPTSSDLLEIWNQSYTSESAPSMSDDFRLEQINRPEATESAPGMTSYARPNGNSLTPNFDRLIARYGAQGREAAPLEVQVQPLSRPRDGFGTMTWKGGTENTVAGGNGKKDNDDDQGGNLQQNNHNNNGNQGGNQAGNGRNNNPPPAPTPEPGTLLLMGVAAGAASWRARRKRNAA